MFAAGSPLGVVHPESLIHENEVGKLAGRNRAEITVQLHDAGSIEGGILKNAAGRNAGLDVELQFAMKSESSHRWSGYISFPAKSRPHHTGFVGIGHLGRNGAASVHMLNPSCTSLPTTFSPAIFAFTPPA